MEASLAGRDVERRRRAVSDGAVVERYSVKMDDAIVRRPQ